MKFATALLICFVSASAFADAVLMKNGERYIGEVTDLGSSLRIKNEAHPDGLEVKKSDVKTVYPKPEAMLAKLRADVEKAKARYEAGKNSADPNAAMKAALDILFDPEVEAEDAMQIYPDFKRQFQDVQTSIHELRKLCRDAQVSGKPPPVPGPDKPDPKPQPDPKPAPDPNSGDVPGGPEKTPPLPPGVSDDVLLLAPPADAKPADIAKAAKAMQARANKHGFEGVTVKVVPSWDHQVIEISCKQGLTKEMRERLVWYGTRTSTKFEVRAARTLSKGEAEQFPVPSVEDARDGTAKAPKGSKWYTYGEDRLCLLTDKYSIVWKDLGKQQVNEDGIVYFEIINKPLANSLHGDPWLRTGKDFGGFYFLGDRGAWGTRATRLLFENDKPFRTWFETGFPEEDWKIAQIMLDHPLPFSLEEVK